jgi:DNA-binding CsgD family transcriptional regulator/PAS domain-containing protein
MKRLYTLLDLIYQCACDSSAWPAFLTAVTETVGASTSVLMLHDVGVQNGNLQASAGFDPALQAEYDNHYGALDYWAIEGKNMLEPGNVLTSGQICPQSELERTEFYNDFLRRLGVAHMLAGVIFRQNTRACAISTLRPSSKGEFGTSETRLLRLLMPHLQRSLDIHRRLASAELKIDSTLRGLDSTICGIVLIDRGGDVIWMNERAEQTMRDNDGITCIGRRLRIHLAEDSDRLGAEITRAASTLATGTATEAVRVRRPSKRAPYLITPVPLRHSMPLGSTLTVTLIITDPTRVPSIPADRLKTLYGFTPAECRLAETLLNGANTREACATLQITSNTLRSQLKELFAKTGTKRQAGLMRVLFASAQGISDR